ncbi:MAG: Gfo/Idh/MocA family oxidoreductase [Vulcanisaeta sp.]
MNSEINVVVIGAGRMGTIHAKNLALLRNVNLLGIVDPDKERGLSLANEIKTNYFPSIDDALSHIRSKVEALIIAVPVLQHFEVVKKVIDLEVPIFLEKPIAPNLKDTLDLVRLVTRRSIKIQMGFMRRHDATFQKIKEYVSRIGKVRVLKLITRDLGSSSVGIGMLYPGSILYDLTIHDFDLVVWYVGFPPKRLHAFGDALVIKEYKDAGDFDTVLINIKYDDALVNIENTRYSTYYDIRVEALGDDGLIRTSNRTIHEVSLVSSRQTINPEIPWFEQYFKDAYFTEIKAFIDSITHNTDPYPGLVESLKSHIMAEMALLSILWGKDVSMNDLLDKYPDLKSLI